MKRVILAMLALLAVNAVHAQSPDSLITVTGQAELERLPNMLRICLIRGLVQSVC